MKRSLLLTVLSVFCAMGISAQSDEFQLSADVLNFEGQAATKEVKVLKGKNYIFFCASDWMTCKELKGGILQISVKPYNFFYPRQASVILTSKKTNYSKVLTVIQNDGKHRPELSARPQGNNLLFLTDMDLSKSKQYFIASAKKNKSVDGNPIKLKASRYADGVATHAPASMIFRLNGASRFIAEMGIDDEVMTRNETETHGHVSYEAIVDGTVKKTGELNLLDPDAVNLDLNVAGGKFLTLKFKEGSSTFGDHVDLVNARFVYSGAKPEMVTEEEMKQPVAVETRVQAKPEAVVAPKTPTATKAKKTTARKRTSRARK